MSLRRFLADEAATRDAGARLAEVIGAAPCWRVTLSGELGAGKTTLVRGLLRHLGCEDRVRSPTYTLVEPYELSWGGVLHLDLYRLADAGELEFLGIDDLETAARLMLVEWPERAGEALGTADLELELALEGAGRSVEIRGTSPRGAAAVERLEAAWPGATHSPDR